jgi:succinate dehydrogenase flavin-adding protein (antitoxin of CptAB toxin-antitoxin module)
MYTLNLTEEEKQTLINLLECSLEDLHSEIVHTDNRCYKQALKDRKQLVIQLLENLRKLQSAS